VGPDSEFRPLHQINPLRLDWIDQLARLRASGAGRGLRRRHPGRVDGAPRRHVLGIDLSTKPLRVAQLHALESGVAGFDYREVAVEALAAEQPAASTPSPAWKCSSTCPTRRRSCRPAHAGASRAAGCSSPPSTAMPRPFCAIVGAEHVLKLLPKGTHEYAALHPPERTGALGRDAGLAAGARGHGYNPLTQRYSLTDDTSVNYLVACRAGVMRSKPRCCSTWTAP
jgi:2-polyprenyl-6-hydroxyphenyl methylase/3-demethylubiquinone-9 3-methyltransferase